MENKRKVAIKIPLNELLKGTYIKRPGWEPSGVLTKYGEVTRVNIAGLIVSLSKSDNSTSMILDDGSANITIRVFEQLTFNPKLGDIVRIIGRVRENSNEIFVVPEIITSIDKLWYELHNLEMSLSKKSSIKLPVEIEDSVENIEAGPYQKILNIITILDKGSGVDVGDIVSNINIKGIEDIIKNLVEEGEIFEISPGRVKLLE